MCSGKRNISVVFLSPVPSRESAGYGLDEDQRTFITQESSSHSAKSIGIS